jgi:DNA polymerase III subunit delta'
MNWENVFGREQMIHSLRTAAAQKRLAHAYLFCGPQGIGKKTLAQALAQTLICEADQACGHCSACRRLQSSGHPDVHRIQPEGKSLKVAQMREVRKQAYLRPREATCQVFILEEADTMTADAANSLLKVLEDPPPATVFILLAQHPTALLPTVASRCQLYQLPRLGREALLSILQASGIPCQSSGCSHAVDGAEGIPGRALMLATQNGAGPSPDAVRVVRGLLEGESPVFLADTLAEQESPGLFADALLTLLRDMMVLQATGEKGLMSAVSDYDELCRFLPYWPPQGGRACLEIAMKLQKDIQNPVNVRLALERALRRLKEVLLYAHSCGYPL